MSVTKGSSPWTKFSRRYATYTAESKPELQRNARFKKLSVEDVEFFRHVLGNDRAIIDGLTKDADDDLASFNIDWTKKYRGKSQLVLKPESTHQVSNILKYCDKKLLAGNPVRLIG